MNKPIAYVIYLRDGNMHSKALWTPSELNCIYADEDSDLPLLCEKYIVLGNDLEIEEFK